MYGAGGEGGGGSVYGGGRRRWPQRPRWRVCDGSDSVQGPWSCKWMADGARTVGGDRASGSGADVAAWLRTATRAVPRALRGAPTATLRRAMRPARRLVASRSEGAASPMPRVRLFDEARAAAAERLPDKSDTTVTAPSARDKEALERAGATSALAGTQRAAVRRRAPRQRQRKRTRTSYTGATVERARKVSRRAASSEAAPARDSRVPAGAYEVGRKGVLPPAAGKEFAGRSYEVAEFSTRGPHAGKHRVVIEHGKALWLRLRTTHSRASGVASPKDNDRHILSVASADSTLQSERSRL